MFMKWKVYCLVIKQLIVNNALAEQNGRPQLY